MDKKHYTISANVPVAPQVYRIELTADAAPQLRAGQFVEVAVPGQFLRRPLSVSLSEPGRLTLRYKVVGSGTATLAAMQPGTQLELLTGLGNGFDLDTCDGRALLLGGGIGVAPLHQLCRDLRAAGRQVTAVLGFNTASEILLRDELAALGAEVHVATADGSAGIRGFVTDALQQVTPKFDYYYVCGPMPMMRALYPLLPDGGEFSLEERMGCGTGLCFGCTIPTTEGPRRICHDGPVFKKNLLPW
ncbi:MAG: dihydroorotate dehydrogenase electron transfer subunit [Bacteroidales bacterium]|nr:dihydroorotate dehydrogenase electron transfer subunit [Bacteroidales bacterium]